MNQKTKSPYAIFKDWLYSDDNAELSDDILKVVNKRSVLSMMGNFGNLTIYLNEYFNCFELMDLDDLEFYKFIKMIVKRKHIDKYSFSFFQNSKKDKKINDLHVKFPYLKKYEVARLINIIETDNNLSGVREHLGLETIKKSKLTKKDKKEFGSISIEKQKNDDISVKDWFSSFNLDLVCVDNIKFQK